MPRITGIDLARCLALLGMAVAHLVSSAPVDGQVDTWYQVVAGRSAALFALLAGVSLALVTRGAVQPGAARTHRLRLVLRAALIGGVGLLLGAFPSGVAVILTYYGVLFLLAVPVLRWRAGPLALLALGWGLLAPVVSLAVRPALPPTSYQVPSPLSLADPWQLLTELTVTGYYPVLTWGTYLFAGMAIGRIDLRSPAWHRRLVVWGAWTAIAALAVARLTTRSEETRAALVDSYDDGSVTTWVQLDVLLRQGLYGAHPTGSPWWLGVWAPHSGSIVDLAHTTGVAMTVLGVCLVLLDLSGARAQQAWRLLAGAGTMSLSLYATHVLVLSLPESVPLSHSVPAHILGILLVGAAFAAAGRRGPLEQTVSRITAEVGRVRPVSR